MAWKVRTIEQATRMALTQVFPAESRAAASTVGIEKHYNILIRSGKKDPVVRLAWVEEVDDPTSRSTATTSDLLDPEYDPYGYSYYDYYERPFATPTNTGRGNSPMSDGEWEEWLADLEDRDPNNFECEIQECTRQPCLEDGKAPYNCPWTSWIGNEDWDEEAVVEITTGQARLKPLTEAQELQRKIDSTRGSEQHNGWWGQDGPTYNPDCDCDYCSKEFEDRNYAALIAKKNPINGHPGTCVCESCMINVPGRSAV